MSRRKDCCRHSPRFKFSAKPFGKRLVWIIFLALLVIISDIAVLFVTFHKFKFNTRLNTQKFPIHDATALQIVSVASTMLRIIVGYIGAVTIAQSWAHRLCVDGCGDGGGGSVAELHSLGIFESISALLNACCHLIRCNFGHRTTIWSLAIVCALHVLLYPTALITLGTPTITSVTGSPTTYQYADLPFMTNPGYGQRCDGASNASLCAGNLLAGSAMQDIGAFDPNLEPISLTSHDDTLWMALRTAYSTSSAVQVWMNLGPLNNDDLSSGAILFAQNFGTIERFLEDGDLVPPPQSSLDVSTFSIDINTTVPFMISRCTLIDQNPSNGIKNVTINGRSYNVPIPIPLVNDGSVIAQVTTDGMALLISFKPDGTWCNIHCAINLGLRSGRITVTQTRGIVSYPLENPWEWGDLRVSKEVSETKLQPITDFAIAWLNGMGWGPSSVRNSVSEILTSSHLSVGTGSTPNAVVFNKTFAEYYTLAILSGGINIAFPPERSSPSSSPGNTATRSHRTTKTQLYLGLITPTRIFWVVIILFNILFMSTCVLIICTRCGWLPNWGDPVTLLCTVFDDTTEDTSGRLAELAPDLWKKSKKRGTTYPWTTPFNIAYKITHVALKWKDGISDDAS